MELILHRAKKAIQAVSAVLAMLLPGGAYAAPAPTSIGSTTQFNGLERPPLSAGFQVNSHCYNFNNFIPPTDSPVIGGIVMMHVGKQPINNPQYVFRGFGKACVTTPLVYASPPNPEWLHYRGYLHGYSASSGDWYIAGAAQSCSDSCVDLPPSVYASCPSNTAPIRANNYVLPDGGILVPSINSYSLRTYTHVWDNPLQYPATYQIRDVILCVKTDTTQ